MKAANARRFPLRLSHALALGSFAIAACYASACGSGTKSSAGGSPLPDGSLGYDATSGAAGGSGGGGSDGSSGGGGAADAVSDALTPSGCTAGTTGKPNIVVIMVDDLDEGSFDILLSNGKLPNIKTNILDTGVRFKESYVANSLCCPSRGTFLTGQYSHNCKVISNNNGFGQFTPHENDSTGTHMKAAGYRTAYLGKYLNGYTSTTYHAPGWDEWQALHEPSVYYMWGFTLIKSIDNAAATQVTYSGTCPTAGQPCTGDSPTNYQIDVLATLGATFIDNAATSNKLPFFLVEMPLAPHVEVLPGQQFATFSQARQLRVRPPTRYLGTLRAKLADGSVDLYNPVSPTFDIPNITAPNFNEADVSDKPGWLRNGPTGAGGWPLLTTQEIQYQRRQHLDRLESMRAVDDLVGTLYAKLDAKGLRSSTVVILTSDNGFSLGSHRLNNKMFPYEEDIRVPLVASCNARTTATDSHLVGNVDLAPTVTDYATQPWSQDGRSLRALLEGSTVVSWRTRFLVEHWYDAASNNANDLPDLALVRTAANDANPTHKYIAYYGLTGLLNQSTTPVDLEEYDLVNDPWELQNAAADPAYQATRDALAPKLQALRTCSGNSCRTADQ